jgi:hypothetical protein
MLFATTYDHVFGFTYEVLVKPHDVPIALAVEEYLSNEYITTKIGINNHQTISFDRGGIAPIHSLEFDVDFVRSRRTISQLIDSSIKRNPYQIVNPIDVIDIFHRLQYFRIETEGYEYADHKRFMVGFDKFESEIKIMTRGVMNQYPDIKKSYTQESMPMLRMILDFYGIKSESLDPVSPISSLITAIDQKKNPGPKADLTTVKEDSTMVMDISNFSTFDTYR